MDMGIEPFLLASTLRVLEAQRLVRRLCKDCKEPYECDPENAPSGTAWSSGSQLFRPKGCDACRGTGYRGRRRHLRGGPDHPADGQADPDRARPCPSCARRPIARG